MHIGNKEILGATYEVHADVQSGNFRIIEPPAEEGERGVLLGNASTLAGAIADARTELNKRKVKVSVPFKTPKGESAVADALHGRSNKVMATVNGRREQFEVHAKVFKADTPPDVFQRLAAADKKMSEARAERDKIEREWRFIYGSTTGLGQAVRNAIDEAVKAQAT